jgi:hypothetical protein
MGKVFLTASRFGIGRFTLLPGGQFAFQCSGAFSICIVRRVHHAFNVRAELMHCLLTALQCRLAFPLLAFLDLSLRPRRNPVFKLGNTFMCPIQVPLALAALACSRVPVARLAGSPLLGSQRTCSVRGREGRN